MPLNRKQSLIAATLCSAVLAAPVALSHLDKDEFHQSYRQSYFALVGATFGPMADMVKGERPWDDTTFQMFANELAGVTQIDVTRAFPEGSDKGMTRAKPEIWSDKADFEGKMKDMREAVAKLNEVAATGDKDAIRQQFGATGKTCKSCHDEYKSKDYLY